MADRCSILRRAADDKEQSKRGSRARSRSFAQQSDRLAQMATHDQSEPARTPEPPQPAGRTCCTVQADARTGARAQPRQRGGIMQSELGQDESNARNKLRLASRSEPASCARTTRSGSLRKRLRHTRACSAPSADSLRNRVRHRRRTYARAGPRDDVDGHTRRQTKRGSPASDC